MLFLMLLCPMIIVSCLLTQFPLKNIYVGLSALILGHVVTKYQQDCTIIMLLFHSVFRLLILIEPDIHSVICCLLLN